MPNLVDQVVLVTGGTSGLGAATASVLAKAGAKVALTGRRDEQGRVVVEQIEKEGGNAVFVKADITVPDDIERMVAVTVEHYGKLDGAVNNAGISGTPFVPAAEIADDDWQTIISTNLSGAFLSMKHEIHAMAQSGGGSIVNVSSKYGLIGSDIGQAAYSASKHGLLGLTKSVANDYGTAGIRANAVCPGFCHSEMVDPYVDAAPDLMQAVVHRHSAMNRLGEADEVARVIAWLLSDASTFVNGAAIPIDGGQGTKLF